MKRVGKVVERATSGAFTNSSAVLLKKDTDKLLPAEQELYEDVLKAILKAKTALIADFIDIDHGNEKEFSSDLEKAVPKTESKTVPKTESKPETKIGPKIETKVEPKIETEVEPKIETKVEPKIETKVEPKIETKVEPKTEPKIETKVEPKIETKVEPKTEPKIETKVEPKTEPKIETSVSKTQGSSNSSGGAFGGRGDHLRSGAKPESSTTLINENYILVRILKDLPEFMGEDKRSYHLKAQDVVTLPAANANLLIRRGVAQNAQNISGSSQGNPES
jgi:DNA replication initiation complex subunit (GINS family)